MFDRCQPITLNLPDGEVELYAQYSFDIIDGDVDISSVELARIAKAGEKSDFTITRPWLNSSRTFGLIYLDLPEGGGWLQDMLIAHADITDLFEYAEQNK